MTIYSTLAKPSMRVTPEVLEENREEAANPSGSPQEKGINE